MEQKHYPAIEFDNGEPDVVVINQHGKRDWNTLMIERELIPGFIQLLLNCEGSTLQPYYKCEDCGERGDRNPEQLQMMLRNDEHETGKTRWLCKPCTIKRYPQTEKDLTDEQ